MNLLLPALLRYAAGCCCYSSLRQRRDLAKNVANDMPCRLCRWREEAQVRRVLDSAWLGAGGLLKGAAV